MTDFAALGARSLGFDRCEVGNNTPHTEVMAETARKANTVEFDPSAEVTHVRKLAYEALHSDSQDAGNKLWNELQGLHGVPYLEAQVVQILSEPDTTRKMPIAKVDYGTSGKIESIGFEPGCLDFDANASIIKFSMQ